MKHRAFVLGGLVAFMVAYGPARTDAGGLFLPGSGAISTSRAGAAVASASDGEALGINPAGLAKAKGTTITVSMALINYAMQFTRRGSYDPIAMEALPYEDQAYPTVTNDPDPPLGIGKFQPIPVIAVVTDLGGKVPGLRLAAGLYAPNAYPFRDLCTELPSGCKKYVFNGDFDEPPAPSRYDIMYQDGAVILPSLAVAYRLSPQLDIGARFGVGFAESKNTVSLWGALNNYEDFAKKDSMFIAESKDSFVPHWGLGLTFRPTPDIELGAAYSSQINVNAEGLATSANGPNATLMGNQIITLPRDDSQARCAPGGTREAQKVCIEFALPMTATLGGRYIFRGAEGKERGDLELNVGWENWSAERVTDYRVVVDGDVYLIDASGNENFAIGLQDSFVKHGFKDTFSVRLGGGFSIPAGAADIVLRGGVAHDTQAAKEGWLRADVDGAARTMVTLGGGYKAKKWEVNVGGGYVIEGTSENPGNCNPDGTPGNAGCASDGTEQDVEDRSGPDPITPVINEPNQTESPFAQGTYKSSYLLFMLGFSTWF